jgi:PPK2 family polyphosphate:nucleotide phosphotransferase
MPDRRPASGKELRERLRVTPGTKVDLERIDPAETHGHTKAGADVVLAEDLGRLESLQERLWASAAGAVLIVLQGIDTSGKGGTIGHVMSAFNPQGCSVVGFKVPTPEELARDYLWRIHRAVPARGHITIFDRSHYEDVLVVRVHGLVPAAVWRRRFAEINDFERLLARSGTTIVKFFLHISREEQHERLQARLDAPDKRWKFRRRDLDERARWDEYREAYEDALSRCATEDAPWFLIPSDHKWFRNLAVASILADMLDDLDLHYPPPEEDLEGLVVE